MAIVKATYTRKGGNAKASVRYIENRPGKDGAKCQRTLFTADGKVERTEVYTMIDQADKTGPRRSFPAAARLGSGHTRRPH